MSRIALIFIGVLSLHAADPEPRWLPANRAAREALLAKDWSKLRAAIAEFAPMVPGNPRVAYNLAVAEVHLGNRDAAQAVGQALGRNPFAPIVPCHRVVGADGASGGFSAHGGVATKRSLLALEGVSLTPALPLFE